MPDVRPLLRHHPGAEWEPVSVPLDSPRPDGSVAYYMDSLSPVPAVPGAAFDDGVAHVLCAYLRREMTGRGLQVTDGPYLQVLSLVSPGYVMIRALAWVEEFDLVVPTDTAQQVTGS